MKKYIALTALLAAGSAFANATALDDLLADYNSTGGWNLSFGSEYEGGYELTGTMTKKGTFWDVIPVEGGTQTNGNKRVHMAGGVYGSWADDFQLEISLTLGDTITASNNWPVFAEIAGNGTSLRFGPYTNAGNYVSLDGTLTKNFTDTNFSVTGGETYTVTLVKIGADVSLYVGGTLVSTGTFPYIEEKEGKIVEHPLPTGNITDIALGGNTGGSYRINEVVHSVSYKTLTLIPEPSTFGLLAGLGALALVGTRRRRK